MTTIEKTDFRRRPFLLEPGDTLLLEPDPIRVMVNFGKFADETGVPTSHLVTSRLCALALPTGQIHDWPDIRLGAAWLPLLWLPPHLRERKHYVVGVDGLAHSVPKSEASNVHMESEEEWCVRVALELTASGFWDAETGTFLDVMDFIGIDVDTEDGRARLGAWLAGRTDEDLELFATGLELEGHLKSSTDPDWALNEVIVNREHLVQCAYATATESLNGTISDLQTAVADSQASLEDAQALFKTVCFAAATWLDDLPLEDGNAEAEGTWWIRRAADAEAFTGDLAGFVSDYVAPASDRLSEIREAVQPLVEVYLGAAAE